MGSIRVLGLLCLAAGVCGCTTIEALDVPARRLDDSRWAISNPSSTREIDHSAWNDFLARYTVKGEDGAVRVRYGAVTPEDKARLDAYINSLEAVDVTTLSRPSQLAYWLNLYNAVTVRIVVENYPVASIRDISPGFLSDGPWELDVVTVNGRALSLNDIEHRILRAAWKDPRIHYALNCAAVQCPNLGRTAYTGANVNEQLDAAARAYVNDPRGVTILADGNLRLSKIYAWFRGDFGGTDKSVLKHLRHYAKRDLERKLMRDPYIDGYVYDWSLNDAVQIGE